jgi:hypothetical protein
MGYILAEDVEGFTAEFSRVRDTLGSFSTESLQELSRVVLGGVWGSVSPSLSSSFSLSSSSLSSCTCTGFLIIVRMGRYVLLFIRPTGQT